MIVEIFAIGFILFFLWQIGLIKYFLKWLEKQL